MINIKAFQQIDEPTDALIIPVCENKQIHTDKHIKALTEKIKDNPDFNGKSGDELVLYDSNAFKAKRIIFKGLGKSGDLENEALKKFSGRCVKQAIQKKYKTMTLVLPDTGKVKISGDAVCQSLMEGGQLANTLFDPYKTKNKDKPLASITLITDEKRIKQTLKLRDKTQIICDAISLARHWVSTPPNDKTPEKLSTLLCKAFQATDLDVSLLKEDDLVKNKFGALLAVASGSTNKPEMVAATYTPKKYKSTILLVGKGITFDSGGLNLKPGSSMLEMKMDMGGAAATAAAIHAIARLKPSVKVIALMPLVENMPSGSAVRPGDIIKSYSGKTIEVGNTDAEGRLILADAIAYGKKQFKPDYIIDMATLTGACVVALGEKMAAHFSNDTALGDHIFQSGQNSGDLCWQLPLHDDYKSMLKSSVADISNMASARWGGAITAALFLKEFAGKTKWAHIDIAGPAFTKKDTDYCYAGGTGFGVRLLCDLICESKLF